uniref:Methyltransferase domain-containing protein n=1 Tax=Strigamia maritima TaxID=126957 RepID=T1J0J5_STRMM
MKQLYLEIFEYEQVLSVPLETFVVLFVLRYLKKCLKIVLVKSKKNESRFHVPSDVLDKYQIIFCEDKSLSFEMKNCILPAICVGENFYVTGLCAVLRRILKFNSGNDVSAISQKLLGFRGGCLTACAEVSLWTRFCEIDLLITTKQLLSTSSKKFHLPSDLLRLEKHLATPVRTHNIYKRRQHLAKEMKKLKRNEKKEKFPNLPNWLREESTLTCLKLTENGDQTVDDLIKQLSLNENFDENPAASNMFRNDYLPQLTHIYAEGTDMTLADIIFYPCIHHILVSLENKIEEMKLEIPLILRWYKLMKFDVNITSAMTDLSMQMDLLSDFLINDDFTFINYAQSSESLQENRDKNATQDPHRSSFTRQTEIDDIFEKIQRSNIEVISSSHPQKKVALDWTALPDVVHPSYGELPNSRILRKCQQVENLVSAILEIAHQGNIIVDFCSGGGHLGIVLAYLLPRCQIIMIDNKEESAARAYNRVQALGLTNAVLYQSNLDYFSGHFDIGTSLHACGVATDLVIQRCLDERAAFVVCPCCYGAVKDNHIITYPRSEKFNAAGISYQDYLVLSHSADQTHVNDPKTKQGKRCMELIDTDRLVQTTKYGYKSTLCTLIPSTCTPKNNLLIGLPQILSNVID